MENLYQAASKQNEAKSNKYINTRHDPIKTILGSSNQRKVENKNEYTLTIPQRSNTALLFSDYGIGIPAWLKLKLRINQRRRKLLNDIFFEAGVNDVFCSTCLETDDYFWPPHEVWHLINGRPSCK